MQFGQDTTADTVHNDGRTRQVMQDENAAQINATIQSNNAEELSTPPSVFFIFSSWRTCADAQLTKLHSP